MIDPSQEPMRITPHDKERLEVNQALTRLLSQCLAMPVIHNGDLLDMLDIALGVASVLDRCEFDTRELSEWYDRHGRTQVIETQRIADAVRTGDYQKVQEIARRLVFQHPLPVLYVDAAAERRK